MTRESGETARLAPHVPQDLLVRARRLIAVLPAGTTAVGAGLAVLGVASYVHLAIAGHALTTGAMSSVSVLWAIVFAVGPGLFLPFEQEVTRVISAQRAARPGGAVAAGPVLRRAAQLAGAVFATLVLAAALFARPLADALFDGDVAMVVVLVAAVGGLALGYLVRGVLAGAGAFGAYGAQLGLDGGLRILIAAALGLYGVPSAAWFSAVLVVAPVLSVLAVLPALRRHLGGHTPVGWAQLCRGLGLLTVSALFAQVLVNVAVVNTKLLAPAAPAIAAAMLAALVLVRVPLFLFASIQATLLSQLSVNAASADRAGGRAAYRRSLTRALVVVGSLGLSGTLVFGLTGPSLTVRLFNVPAVLGRADFVWLGLATTFYLVAMVLGQAALAVNRHLDQALSWVIGVALLAAVTLAPGGVVARTERGYLIGSLAVAASLAVALALAARRPGAHAARAMMGGPR